MQRDTTHQRNPIPLYIACYAIWIVQSALGLWLTLQLRVNLIDLVMFLELGPWILGAVDKFGTVALGLIWLVAVVALEIYLRGGVERGLLRPRATRITVIIVALLGSSYLLQWLLV